GAEDAARRDLGRRARAVRRLPGALPEIGRRLRPALLLRRAALFARRQGRGGGAVRAGGAREAGQVAAEGGVERGALAQRGSAEAGRGQRRASRSARAQPRRAEARRRLPALLAGAAAGSARGGSGLQG